MRNKVVFFKAHALRKKYPELTFKEAYRRAAIKHNYRSKGEKINA